MHRCLRTMSPRNRAPTSAPPCPPLPPRPAPAAICNACWMLQRNGHVPRREACMDNGCMQHAHACTMLAWLLAACMHVQSAAVTVVRLVELPADLWLRRRGHGRCRCRRRSRCHATALPGQQALRPRRRSSSPARGHEPRACRRGGSSRGQSLPPVAAAEVGEGRTHAAGGGGWPRWAGGVGERPVRAAWRWRRRRRQQRSRPPRARRQHAMRERGGPRGWHRRCRGCPGVAGTTPHNVLATQHSGAALGTPPPGRVAL